MKAIKQTITIGRSAQEAFDFTLAPENTPKWVSGVITEQTNETPTKLGTTYRNQDHEGNWREFRITAFEPGTVFEMTEKSRNVRVRYTFTPLDDNQCQLEYYVRTDSDGLKGPFKQATIEQILRKLKAVIEG